MSEQDTDKALVLRVQQGDQQAFDLLVKKYQHKVMSLISRYVKQAADVPDVAQEAFIKAYRAIGNFRGECVLHMVVSHCREYCEKLSGVARA